MRFTTTHDVGGTRREIVESWLRSEDAVPCDRDEAPMDDNTTVAAEWRSSPVREPLESLRDEIASVADDGFIVAVTDEVGKILFTHGGRTMRTRAERVNFAPGARWDEWSMGTNALGLSLTTGHASCVFSAEHFSAAVHEWVCYAAPIVDHEGRSLGVIDLSTTWDRANPLAMTTARTMARFVSERLPRASLVPERPEPLELRLLGSTRVSIGGTPVHLSPRQVELLAILALHPDGLSLEALHGALYGGLAEATLGTCRAEVSHLRQRLPGVIGSRPYRLTGRTVVDAIEVLRLVRAGRVAEAARWYGGELLPDSEAPALVEERHVLSACLRAAVLTSCDAEALLRLGEVEPADDEIQLASLAALPPGDPRGAILVARLGRA